MLTKFAKSIGYRVYTSHERSKKTQDMISAVTYIYIESENGICYAQSTNYSGFSFSSVHRSKRGSGLGTGFRLTEHREDYRKWLSKEKIDEAISVRFPRDYKPTKKEIDYGVEKYQSMDDYEKFNSGLIIKEL